MHNQSEKLKIVLPIIIGFVAIILLTFYVPDIWTSNRNYRASQKPSATEKMARFCSCLIEAGFVEGMPDGDFTLDPVYEMVDGVKTVKAFFYRFPDGILSDESKVLQIEACKNAAAR